MAYSAIPKSSSYFNTKLYTGNGGTQTISGIGFEPSFVWFKTRSSTSHMLQDQVRGTTKFLESNTNSADQTSSDGISSFNSDGYAIGGNGRLNSNGTSMVSWNWKANGQGSSNTDGTINSTYTSVNTTSGFSIVEFTASGSGGTVGHGLGVAPKVIIFKRLDAASDWAVYNESVGNVNMVFLNTSTAAGSNASILNSTSPTSSVFTVGSSNIVTGGPVIAYCFAEKQGYSKFGSYVGNGNADGAMIYTGFKPAFVMIKRTDAGDNWNMFDDKRVGYNYSNYRLFANSTSGEETSASAQRIDIVSNGFKLRSNETDANGNGNNYIYMAFGQPIVSTNGDIATAR